MNGHNEHVPTGRDVHEATSSGGGSIGCEVQTDVSEGHVVCSRDDHGPIEPGNTSAKSPPATAREFEHAMRLLGYSKRQAKTIASLGFKGLGIEDPAGDVSDQFEQLAAALRRGAKK